MPFRGTDPAVRLACLVAAIAAVVAGCHANTGGSAAPAEHADPAMPVPGIAATHSENIAPETLACVSTPAGTGQEAVATVADPAAPRITINVPDGWNTAPGSGDTALTMTGPDTMSAAVTITATDLAPESAFLRHTAGVGGTAPRLKFSITGAPFCGYSSQQLTGTLQGPSGGIDFADRVTHIWTNTKQYLVTIHLEGRSGSPGFSAAKSALTQDFAVVIP